VKAHLQHTALGSLLALGIACGGDTTTPGQPVTSGTPPVSTGAAGTSSAAGTRAPANTPSAPVTAGGGAAVPPPPATTTGNPGATPAGSGATAGTAAPVAAAGSGAPAAGAGSDAAGTAAPMSTGGLPHVTTTDGAGPYKEVVKEKNVGPGGWLIYPKDIGKDGVKHPLFVFGPGGGTTPSTYESSGMHWDRYGSYGFVIYAVQMSGQSGAPMKAAIDWLIAQNDKQDSPLYQKLDTTKICAAGHSMGSVMTFASQPDERVTTTIHISGGSFDGMGPSRLMKPTMFLCGPSQSADTAYPQCERDFMNTTVPTFYTAIQGSDHLTSGRLGWPAIIAWMLWHLSGHEEWKKEFLETSGQFHMGQYKSQIKNW